MDGSRDSSRGLGRDREVCGLRDARSLAPRTADVTDERVAFQWLRGSDRDGSRRGGQHGPFQGAELRVGSHRREDQPARQGVPDGRQTRDDHRLHQPHPVFVPAHFGRYRRRPIPRLLVREPSGSRAVARPQDPLAFAPDRQEPQPSDESTARRAGECTARPARRGCRSKRWRRRRHGRDSHDASPSGHCGRYERLGSHHAGVRAMWRAPDVQAKPAAVQGTGRQRHRPGKLSARYATRSLL